MERKMVCPPLRNGCGGCREMGKDYRAHLLEKQQAICALFPDARLIRGAEHPLRYRNKVLRTFANGKTDLYFGMYKTGTHQVVSVRECLLENPRANRIANTALELLAEMGLTAYREDFHKGCLRHLQVRRAPKSGETLVTVVTGSGEFPEGRQFAERLMQACPEVRGVIQNINDRSTSAVLGFRDRVLFGRDEIWDEMCGLKVCLSSRVFYQVHTAQAEKLYRFAVDSARLTEKDTVLDAYCGVGVIGMLAAKEAGSVTGVEIAAPSVACAKRAAAANRIGNIDFLRADAGAALARDPGRFSVVFVDPPRAGCSADFLRRLALGRPERIVYISCCPDTLKRDLDLLRESGYRPGPVQPFDLFPYTEHVETVVLMSRKDT